MSKPELILIFLRKIKIMGLKKGNFRWPVLV